MIFLKILSARLKLNDWLLPLLVPVRAVGIPSRLVTGCAGGAYTVTEAEAHSWVEVYFPGLGWVKFKPTAGQPGLIRPLEAPAEAQAAAFRRWRREAFRRFRFCSRSSSC